LGEGFFKPINIQNPYRTINNQLKFRSMKKVVFISLVCLMGTMVMKAETTLSSISAMEPLTVMVKTSGVNSGEELIGSISSEPELAKAVNATTKTFSGDSISKENLTNTLKTDSATVKNQSNEQIVIKKGRCYMNDQKLKGSDLKNLLNSDPESAAAYAKSRSLQTTGIVVMLAIDVALFVATGSVLGVLPAVLVTLPFSIPSQKHFNNAIAIYNSKHGGIPYRIS
jgi:hypothetical protein